MEPNVFLGCPKRGIAHSLSPCRHEQYPSKAWTKVILPMVFTMYMNEDIMFLVCFVKAM